MSRYKVPVLTVMYMLLSKIVGADVALMPFFSNRSQAKRNTTATLDLKTAFFVRLSTKNTKYDRALQYRT